MSSISENARPYFGSIVAVEGDPDTISTQLQLLPPSSKILIFPPLAECVPSRECGGGFDARCHVRDVHEVLSSRHKSAISYLQAATPEQPRLVFMNGGCISARTVCIKSLRDHLTNGDSKQAEALLEDLVKDGCPGLVIPAGTESTRLYLPLGRTSTISSARKAHPDSPEDTQHFQSEDPETLVSSAGMLPTVYPVSSQQIVEDRTRQDDISIKPVDSTDNLQDKAQGTVCKTPEIDVEHPVLAWRNGVELAGEHEDQQNMSDIITMDEHYGKTRQTVTTTPEAAGKILRKRNSLALPYGPPPRSPDYGAHIESTDENGQGWTALSIERHDSAPPTPGLVEYGEARLVKVQSPKIARVLKRVNTISPRRVKTSNPTNAFCNSRSTRSLDGLLSSGAQAAGKSRLGSSGYAKSVEFLPEKALVQDITSHIRTPHSLNLSTFRRRIFVDRGTNSDFAEPVLDDMTTEVSDDMPEAPPYAPVFPMIEDIVIHFTGGNVDEILDSVILAYKIGIHSQPISPITPTSCSHAIDETDAVLRHQRHMSDLNNTESYRLDPDYGWLQSVESKNSTRPMPMTEPPTPAATPPPYKLEPGLKIQTFFPPLGNAIDIQDSFRSLLKTHFSPEKSSYRQLPFLADDDRLWKPVFRSNENSESIDTVDLIVAVGMEDGVKKDLFQEIAGQIERFGSKKTGQNQTGKLDIKYLITTAVQAFGFQPFITQPSRKPMSDPRLLATLIVTQLESYMLLNASIRFLVLEYPASCLPIVIALRNLLGSERMKVAGIIDSLASDPPKSLSRSKVPAPLNLVPIEGAKRHNSPGSHHSSFSRIRTKLQRQVEMAREYSVSRKSSNLALSFRGNVSFSKADFLLPSTATDAEISTFLSNIWEALIKKSDFYVPEPPSPKSVAVLAAPPIPPTPAVHTSEYAPRSPTTLSGFRKQVRAVGKSDQILGTFPRPNIHSSRTKSTRIRGEKSSGPADVQTLGSSKASYAASVKTTTTAPTTLTNGEGRRLRRDKEWDDFYLGDDSEDEIDRMLMPHTSVGAARKANSRKALKWLGLA